MKNPQKQFIFTCFPAILRSRPCARFPLPAAYFSRNRFCRYGALPSCLFASAARRALSSSVPPDSHTHAPRKSASEFAGKISRTLSACIFCTSCRSSRRTYFSPSVCVRFSRNKPPDISPSVCVRFSRNKPHARRNAAFARLTSAAEPTTAESNRNRTDNSRPFIFLRHTPHHVAFPRPPHQTAQAKST